MPDVCLSFVLLFTIFIIVVTLNLVLQQSKNVTAKCSETLSPRPSIQFSLCTIKLIQYTKVQNSLQYSIVYDLFCTTKQVCNFCSIIQYTISAVQFTVPASLEYNMHLIFCTLKELNAFFSDFYNPYIFANLVTITYAVYITIDQKVNIRNTQRFKS